MTMHDAAMLQFRQWWYRNVRSGYAYAAGSSLHGAAPEHLHLVCLDRNDNEVRLLGPEPVPVPFRARR